MKHFFPIINVVVGHVRFPALLEACCAARFAPMEFRVTLEPDEDGVFVAECPALPGCVSQGKTRDEADEPKR